MANVDRAPPELLGLLAEAKLHPEDDAPRLVLADWLEEHGAASLEAPLQRAEFVRLQVQAERLPRGMPKREGLEAQAEAILAKHGEQWLGPTLPAVARKVFFRSGLLDLLADPKALLAAPWDRLQDTAAAWLGGLTLNPDPTLEQLDGLLHCPVMQLAGELALTAGPGLSRCRPEAVRALAAADRPPSLTRLRMEEWRLRPEELQPLFGSPLWPGVKEFTYHTGQVGDWVGGWAPHFSGLRSLALGHNRIGDAGVEALAGSPHLAKLEVLRLGFNRFGAGGCRALATGEYLGQLRELHLDSTTFKAADVQALAASVERPRLRRLSLKECGLSGKSVAALVESPLADHLEWLELDLNKIGDAGAKAIADSPRLTKLKYLIACGNGIGDKGALALAASANLPSLEFADLRYQEIDPRNQAALRERWGEGVVF